MSTIKISDEDDRLKSFYSQNPDFDILKFNLSDEAALSQLNWDGLERETILDLLKKYQRLLRINPDPEIAKKLLNPPLQVALPLQAALPVGMTANPSFDSAQAIASMSEEQFVKIFPGNEGDARQTYKNAIDRTTKMQLLGEYERYSCFPLFSVHESEYCG